MNQLREEFSALNILSLRRAKQSSAEKGPVRLSDCQSATIANIPSLSQTVESDRIHISQMVQELKTGYVSKSTGTAQHRDCFNSGQNLGNRKPHLSVGPANIKTCLARGHF